MVMPMLIVSLHNGAHFTFPLHDDIICDRPRFVGTLAGVAIAFARMRFILTYTETFLQYAIAVHAIKDWAPG